MHGFPRINSRSLVKTWTVEVALSSEELPVNRTKDVDDEVGMLGPIQPALVIALSNLVVVIHCCSQERFLWFMKLSS